MIDIVGKVKFVIKGQIFAEPLPPFPDDDASYGEHEIRLESGGDGAQDAKPGKIGVFQGKRDTEGVFKAQSVDWTRTQPRKRSAPRQKPALTGPVQRTADSFVHPYNFVSCPAGMLSKLPDGSPFHRSEAAEHDRYDPNRNSGWVDCRLTFDAHWFIPHPQKMQKTQSDDDLDGHATLGYFTLDPVTNWQHDDPGADTTRPALPAASLRGMIRSVFEAATLSCFSVFDPEHLEMRATGAPDYVARNVKIPANRGKPEYVPVRVVSRTGKQLVLQELVGRTDRDPPGTSAAAWVHAYQPVVLKSKRPGAIANEFRAIENLDDGHPVAATVNARPQPWKNRRGFQVRRASKVVPASEWARLMPVGHGEVVIFGYLHRTGPNIENKHDERIFFRWDDAVNPPPGTTGGDLQDRFDAFQKDIGPQLVVDLNEESNAVTRSEKLLVSYAERHEKELRKQGHSPQRRREIRNKPSPPYVSEFIGRGKEDAQIRPGQLLYALIETCKATGSCPAERTVHGLYPVAMPRFWHENSVGELLPTDYYPCSRQHEICKECKKAIDGRLCKVCLERHKRLCPACRVFGWVRDLSNQRRTAADADRVDAVAGHVRFTHGLLQGEWPAQSGGPQLASLAILGSPKPTQTLFYLQERDDSCAARQGRWPPFLQSEKQLLYRSQEAILRGRKMYRRQSAENPLSDNAADGGVLRHDAQCDSQNQTVHLLPSGMSFGFRVFFDNLTDAELGALLFSLTLQRPPQWPDDDRPLAHSFGHGKPLGLGCCRIEVTDLQRDCYAENDDHRFRRVPDFSVELPTLDQPRDGTACCGEFVSAYGAAWSEAELANSDDLQRIRGDLLEMLSAAPIGGPIHYPPKFDRDKSDEVEFAENFTWFMANRRGKRPVSAGKHVALPHPQEERSRPEKRLPYDPTEPNPRR